jgi:hypothetical protein
MLLITALGGTTGCTLLPGWSTPGTELEFYDGAQGAYRPTTSEISVVTRSARGKQESSQTPHVQGMLLHEALDKTGAAGRFRRCRISLVRAGVAGRMKVQYDNGRRQIEPLYDYALSPGDTVLVEEDTTTVVDDMLKAVTGDK